MRFEADSIHLTNFAPLIQLWAGICLLFFYENFVIKSPLASAVKALADQYDKFLFRYMIYFNDNDWNTDFSKDKWENFMPVIKNLAALSFLYSVFILAYIGIEPNSEFCRNNHCALEVMNFAILIFMLIDIMMNGVTKFHTYWVPTIEILLIILYFHNHIVINTWLIEHGVYIGEYMTNNEITVFTIFTSISGIFFIFLEIPIMYVGILRKRFSIWLTDRKYKKIIRNGDVSNEETREIIARQYYTLITSRWQLIKEDIKANLDYTVNK